MVKCCFRGGGCGKLHTDRATVLREFVKLNSRGHLGDDGFRV